MYKGKLHIPEDHSEFTWSYGLKKHSGDHYYHPKGNFWGDAIIILRECLWSEKGYYRLIIHGKEMGLIRKRKSVRALHHEAIRHFDYFKKAFCQLPYEELGHYDSNWPVIKTYLRFAHLALLRIKWIIDEPKYGADQTLAESISRHDLPGIEKAIDKLRQAVNTVEKEWGEFDEFPKGGMDWIDVFVRKPIVDEKDRDEKELGYMDWHRQQLHYKVKEQPVLDELIAELNREELA